MNTTATYCWRIGTDHLFNPAWDGVINEAGTVGPAGAPILNDEALSTRYENRATFYMYDDDGELYYTGKLYWNGDDEPSEEIIGAPLFQFGAGSGCTRISYRARRHWDIG